MANFLRIISFANAIYQQLLSGSQRIFCCLRLYIVLKVSCIISEHVSLSVAIQSIASSLRQQLWRST